MYNNSYLNNGQYGQYYPNYMQGAYGMYQPMQTQQKQNSIQPTVVQQVQQVQAQDTPFSDVVYGTLDEAKAYRVGIGKPVMFINRVLKEAYIKSLNNMGEPVLLMVKYQEFDGNSSNKDRQELDVSKFIKQDDLKDYITKDDLKNVFAEIDRLKKRLEFGDRKPNNKGE